MKLDFDVVIIGAGVAGMTAAIYLKRSGINCCLIERDVPGGQINKSSSVKNYPGFVDITGPDLSSNIFKQVTELGVTYKYGNVLKIELENDHKIVKTDKQDTSDVTVQYNELYMIKTDTTNYELETYSWKLDYFNTTEYKNMINIRKNYKKSKHNSS